MKRHATILAGTAVGLLMATAPVVHAGAPVAIRPTPEAAPQAQPFVLIQAESEDEEEEENRKRRQQREAPAEEAPADEAPANEAPGERAPAEQVPAEQAPAEQPGEPAPAGEARPEPQPEPETTPQERQADPEATPPAEEPARRSEPQEEVESPPEPEPAPQAREPAPQEEPDEPAPRTEPDPAPAEQPETEQPEEEQPPADEPAVQPADEEQPGASGAEETPSRPSDDQPDAGEAPAEQTPADAPRPEPAPQVAPEDGAPEPEPRPQAPDADESDGDRPAGADSEASPESAAPVLDSAKEEPDDGDRPVGESAPDDAAAPEGETEAEGQTRVRPDGQPEESGPPPADDSAAQEEARPVELQPVTAEEGRRIERRPEDRRQERPEGAEIVREIGDRIVIRIDNRIIVEGNDRPRIARGARDVYYEELPRGRIREVILRENGVQIVTIRDRYGDVIRRSRIAPDGRETVLVYVEEDYYDRVRDWRDPGRDLPPMRLTIPAEEYILDARRVDDPDRYYTFLDQPPVERVERLYSIDEVKRSARIRDKTRRVDLDTITFEFGSASIAESEVRRLEGVARAIERLLEENPAETFLVEGHTDAVGSDIANLALSDRRAEAVADALTNVFAIPPENLATQGYGEQYLKIKTEEPERENRRVAIRRITPLVAPVASAQ